MKPSTVRTLAVLRDRGAAGLTPLEALEVIHTQRLAARVYELEAEGYRITRTLETTPSGARVARYHLHERPVQLSLLDPVPSAEPAAVPLPRVARAPLSAGGRTTAAAPPGAG